MRKLLTAQFYRLWKERIFWLCLVFMSIGTIWYNWVAYNEGTETQIHLEENVFCMLPISGFVFALLISMRLGTELEEHTIRNKLMVGYSRTQIYFAEYIACTAASLLLLGTMLASSTVFGLLLGLEFQGRWTQIAFLFFCCGLMTGVFSALFVAIGMNLDSKAASIVASLVLLFAILLTASFFVNVLEEPPLIYPNVRVTAGGGVQLGELAENPQYIDGVQRRVYELLADLLPTGQAIQMNVLEFERALRWPVLSALMLAITTAAGYLLFRKRDIR